MHKILWKIFRYVLWLLLAGIALLLLIWLAKSNRNAQAYIQSLNQKSRSEARQQGGIGWIFRGEMNTVTSDELLVPGTWDVELGSWDLELWTGVDVYDPTFEQDLNQIPQDTLSSGDYADTETDFGFVTDGTQTETTTTPSTWTSKSQQLLEIIKREK